jgi:hypothetical protein
MTTIRKEMGRPRTHGRSNTSSSSRSQPASNGVGGTRQPRGRSGDGNSAKRKKDAEDKAKNTAGVSAALGVGLAAAGAITAAALAAFASSDGADIKFTKITTEQTTDSFVPGFFTDLIHTVSTPKNIEITWEFSRNPQNPLAIPSAVRIVKGDNIDMFDLPPPLDKLNGTGVSPKVIKVKGDNVFVIETKIDTSKVNIINQGRGTIQTNFEDQLDQTAADTAGGIGDVLGSAAGNFMSHIGTALFILAICILIYFGVKAMSGISKGSGGNNGNNGNNA